MNAIEDDKEDQRSRAQRERDERLRCDQELVAAVVIDQFLPDLRERAQVKAMLGLV